MYISPKQKRKQTLYLYRRLQKLECSFEKMSLEFSIM